MIIHMKIDSPSPSWGEGGGEGADTLACRNPALRGTLRRADTDHGHRHVIF